MFKELFQSEVVPPDAPLWPAPHELPSDDPELHEIRAKRAAVVKLMNDILPRPSERPSFLTMFRGGTLESVRAEFEAENSQTMSAQIFRGKTGPIDPMWLEVSPVKEAADGEKKYGRSKIVACVRNGDVSYDWLTPPSEYEAELPIEDQRAHIDALTFAVCKVAIASSVECSTPQYA